MLRQALISRLNPGLLTIGCRHVWFVVQRLAVAICFRKAIPSVEVAATCKCFGDRGLAIVGSIRPLLAYETRLTKKSINSGLIRAGVEGQYGAEG